MENMNFARNGEMRLPPGFRFHPTDEELIVQYLKRKVFSCPLPASIIPEIDVCKYDPWDLPGELDREKYFFNITETKLHKENRPNRATGSGYWKGTGSEKQIVACRSNQVVGMKKTYVFYKGKPPNVSKTVWIMHEYCLSDAGSRANIFPQRKNSTHNSMMQMEDWVLCRIFEKKSSSNKKEEKLGVATKGLIDITVDKLTDLGSSSLSSSSNLRSITELSSIDY